MRGDARRVARRAQHAMTPAARTGCASASSAIACATCASSSMKRDRARRAARGRSAGTRRRPSARRATRSRRRRASRARRRRTRRGPTPRARSSCASRLAARVEARIVERADRDAPADASRACSAKRAWIVVCVADSRRAAPIAATMRSPRVASSISGSVASGAGRLARHRRRRARRTGRAIRSIVARSNRSAQYSQCASMPSARSTSVSVRSNFACPMPALDAAHRRAREREVAGRRARAARTRPGTADCATDRAATPQRIDEPLERHVLVLERLADARSRVRAASDRVAARREGRRGTTSALAKKPTTSASSGRGRPATGVPIAKSSSPDRRDSSAAYAARNATNGGRPPCAPSSAFIAQRRRARDSRRHDAAAKALRRRPRGNRSAAPASAASARRVLPVRRARVVRCLARAASCCATA